MDAGDLVVHYQPQADPRTGAILGVEALVRWNHPQLGLLPPARFLPVAEQTGLMRPLTLAVLDQAIAQGRAWQRAGRDLRMSVNLAAVNMLDHGLPQDVAAALDRHGADPGLLVLEVTEHAVMADAQRAARILGELRAMGVGVSLDDFGTGHSSLAWLETLPVDELKIDRAFVQDVATRPTAAAIVRATVELARALSLRTVAEGAEDQAAWLRLEALGCDLIQGYVLTPPLPPQALETWLTQRMAATPSPPPGALRAS